MSKNFNIGLSFDLSEEKGFHFFFCLIHKECVVIILFQCICTIVLRLFHEQS